MNYAAKLTSYLTVPNSKLLVRSPLKAAGQNLAFVYGEWRIYFPSFSVRTNAVDLTAARAQWNTVYNLTVAFVVIEFVFAFAIASTMLFGTIKVKFHINLFSNLKDSRTCSCIWRWIAEKRPYIVDSVGSGGTFSGISCHSPDHDHCRIHWWVKERDGHWEDCDSANLGGFHRVRHILPYTGSEGGKGKSWRTGCGLLFLKIPWDIGVVTEA